MEPLRIPRRSTVVAQKCPRCSVRLPHKWRPGEWTSGASSGLLRLGQGSMRGTNHTIYCASCLVDFDQLTRRSGGTDNLRLGIALPAVPSVRSSLTWLTMATLSTKLPGKNCNHVFGTPRDARSAASVLCCRQTTRLLHLDPRARLRGWCLANCT